MNQCKNVCRNATHGEYDLTERICRGLEEIKSMESGEKSSKSAWDLMEELEDPQNTNPDEESLTQRICRGLEEVKAIMDGKIKGHSVEDLLNEL